MKKKIDPNKPQLTKPQMVALLVNAYHELHSVFQELPKFKKLNEDELRRNRIIEDLEYLITKGFKVNPKEVDHYDIFASDFNV